MTPTDTLAWLDSLFPECDEPGRVDYRSLSCRVYPGEDMQIVTTFNGAAHTRVLLADVPDPTATDGRVVPVEVRSEIFTLAGTTTQDLPFLGACLNSVVDIVAASLASDEPGLLPQPGQLVVNVVTVSEEILDPSITVRHGILVSPWVWPDGVPHFLEQVGHVELCGDMDAQDPAYGRMTVPLQLMLLTDEEYRFATTYGVAALQESLSSQGVDVTDLRRQPAA